MLKKSTLFILLLCMVFQDARPGMVPVITTKFHQVTHLFARLKQILGKHRYLVAAGIVCTVLYKKKTGIGRFCTRIFNSVKARLVGPVAPAQQQAPAIVPIAPEVVAQPAPVAMPFLPVEQYPQNALFDAIEHNDIGLVQYLLPHRDQFRVLNGQHNDILSHAVILDRLAIVRLFLDAGLRLDSGNYLLPSPLHVAARYGHRDIAHELLAHPHRLDVNYRIDATALHIAAEYGHIGVLEELLGAGANIDEPNHHRETALYLAAFHGHSAIVRMLAARGANLDPAIDQMTGLPYAGEGPLHIAATHGHFDTVRTLIQAGANINATNHQGQLFDQVTNDPRIMAFRPLDNQLFDAIGRDNHDGAAAALEAGASPLALNQAGSSPIHEAIDVYQPEATVRDLIARSMIRSLGQRATRARDARGRTPLHRAALRNNLRLTLMLLHAGGDVNAQDTDGNTPLHFAADHLMRNLLLLRYGADATIVNGEGLTPIQSNVALWQYGS